SRRIPAVVPESARWVDGVLEAQAPVLGRAQREGGVRFQVAEGAAWVRLREGDVATVDPVRGTLALASAQDAESELAAAEALRAYDGLRDAQALLHWWEARRDSEPRAGALLLVQRAARVADGGARADDFQEVARAVAAALPGAQRQRLAQEERLALDEAAAAAERALRDELASLREAATALAIDRITARAQARWEGLRSLAGLLGRGGELSGAAGLWSEFGRAAQQRRAGLAAAPGAEPLAAVAAVAGASVPLRAVLEPAFFSRFLAENRLEARISDISGDASSDLRRKSARIRALFLGGRIGPDSGLGQDILGRLPRAETYAVSGAYEDFPQVPRAEVLDKVAAAWAAGYDPGPLGERKRAAQGGQVAEPDAALTISAVVQAEVSGTVFSRDPVSGNRSRIVVSAVKRGGGTAQEFLLERRTGRELRAPGPGSSATLLEAADLDVLARAARALDDQEGRGVELEFCRGADGVFLLGSRAIPGLGEEPARAAPFTITPPAGATVEPVRSLR
ncbi:MAG: hypothetical protein PHU21_10515, partial [Elusimicrobia bacterium]|nr:hypothetical protein [Elusimicrobiota bacterium]